MANSVENYFSSSETSAVVRAESVDITPKPGQKGYIATLYVRKGREQEVMDTLKQQGVEILSTATAQEYEWRQRPEGAAKGFVAGILDRMRRSAGIPTSDKEPVLGEFTAISVSRDSGLLVKDISNISDASPDLMPLQAESGFQSGMRRYFERFDTMSQRTILSQIGQFFMLWSGQVYGNSAFQASAGASILANSILIYYGNRASYDEKAFHTFKEEVLGTFGLEGDLAAELLKDIPELSNSARVRQKSFDLSDAIKTPGSTMQLISGIPEFERNGNPATIIDGSISVLSKLVTFNTIPKGEQEKELYKIGREDLLTRKEFSSKHKPWEDQHSYGMALHRFMSRIGLGKMMGTEEENGAVTLTGTGKFFYKLLDKFDLRIFGARAKEIGFRRAVGFEGMAISGALDFIPLGIKYAASINRAMPVRDENGHIMRDEHGEMITRPSVDWRQGVGSTLFSLGRFMQIANDSSTTELNLEQVAQWSAKLLVQTGQHESPQAIQFLAKKAHDMAIKYERQHFVTVGQIEHAIRGEVERMHSDVITLANSKREVQMAEDLSTRIDQALSKQANIASSTKGVLPKLSAENSDFVRNVTAANHPVEAPQL